MFEKVQMEVMKAAAKIDKKSDGLTFDRPQGKFPYIYGYTDGGDLLIATGFVGYIIQKWAVYINLEAVFRGNPIKGVARLLDDSKAGNATMTNELVQLGDKLTRVFETENGERVYIDTKLLKQFDGLKIPLKYKAASPISPVFVYTDTGEKLGLVLPVRPEGYDNKRRH